MDQGKILASGWRANLGIALLVGKVASSYICFFPSNLLQQLSQHGMRCQLNGKKRKGLKKALLSGEMQGWTRTGTELAPRGILSPTGVLTFSQIRL
jgi:hypothetical protein